VRRDPGFRSCSCCPSYFPNGTLSTLEKDTPAALWKPGSFSVFRGNLRIFMLDYRWTEREPPTENRLAALKGYWTRPGRGAAKGLRCRSARELDNRRRARATIEVLAQDNCFKCRQIDEYPFKDIFQFTTRKWGKDTVNFWICNSLLFNFNVDYFLNYRHTKIVQLNIWVFKKNICRRIKFNCVFY